MHRLASDPVLDGAGSDSTEVWAPVHARRVLGQLRAEESVLPLLAVLEAAKEAHTAAVATAFRLGLRLARSREKPAGVERRDTANQRRDAA